jgi:hypothetical protein
VWWLRGCLIVCPCGIGVAGCCREVQIRLWCAIMEAELSRTKSPRLSRDPWLEHHDSNVTDMASQR